MQLVVTKANTLQATQWIKNAWRLFTLKPSLFLAMTGIILVFSFVSAVAPLASILVMFLMPFLNAGYYQVASQVEQEQHAEATDIFVYFKQIPKYKVFLRLALVSVLLSLPMTSVLMAILESAQQGIPAEPTQIVALAVLMALNFMLLAFAVPAAWIAPDTPVMKLLSQSFSACWYNALPLTLYGLLLALLTIISAPIIIIGWLAMMCVSTLSFYQAFLDIYRPVQTEVTIVDESEESASNQEEVLTQGAENEQNIKDSEQSVQEQTDESGTDNRRD